MHIPFQYLSQIPHSSTTTSSFAIIIFSMHDHHSWLRVYYFFNIYFKCNVMPSRQVLNPGCYFNGNMSPISHTFPCSLMSAFVILILPSILYGCFIHSDCLRIHVVHQFYSIEVCIKIFGGPVLVILISGEPHSVHLL